MCVVSMVTDHYIQKWPVLPQPYQHPYPPNLPWYPQPAVPSAPDAKPNGIDVDALKDWLNRERTPTAEEIAEFRKDMAEFKVLLERAREYDKRNNEPHCELDSKKAAIKAIADHFGVEINFL